MDVADIADGMIESETAYCIRSSRKPPVERTGHCLNCEAPLSDPGTLYCDDHCKEDWERRERAARRDPRAFQT